MASTLRDFNSGLATDISCLREAKCPSYNLCCRSSSQEMTESPQDAGDVSPRHAVPSLSSRSLPSSSWNTDSQTHVRETPNIKYKNPIRKKRTYQSSICFNGESHYPEAQKLDLPHDSYGSKPWLMYHENQFGLRDCIKKRVCMNASEFNFEGDVFRSGELTRFQPAAPLMASQLPSSQLNCLLQQNLPEPCSDRTYSLLSAPLDFEGSLQDDVAELCSAERCSTVFPLQSGCNSRYRKYYRSLFASLSKSSSEVEHSDSDGDESCSIHQLKKNNSIKDLVNCAESDSSYHSTLATPGSQKVSRIHCRSNSSTASSSNETLSSLILPNKNRRRISTSHTHFDVTSINNSNNYSTCDAGCTLDRRQLLSPPKAPATFNNPAADSSHNSNLLGDHSPTDEGEYFFLSAASSPIRPATAGVSSSSQSEFANSNSETNESGRNPNNRENAYSQRANGVSSCGGSRATGGNSDGSNSFPPADGDGGDDDDKNELSRDPLSKNVDQPKNTTDEPVVIEFPVKHFWKVAKQQNDIESSEVGHCRGFFYRLLIHPKGTAGTDSEASHLSVFLEAVRQDWFPDDWVFPNVKFELTVVNFRDPKQSVTSWAHWSFSNEATSRGWQKMLSHSRLSRISGFMDDEGTVLIRGKAEPPYAALWSRAPRYRPRHLWALMPQQVSTNNVHGGGMFSSGSSSSPMASASLNISGSSGVNSSVPSPWRESHSILQLCDLTVPSLRTALHADFISCFILILYHIREFRREVFLWNASLHPFNVNCSPEIDTSLSPAKTLHGENSPRPARDCCQTIVEALQSTFAEMQLWPLACAAMEMMPSSSDHAQQGALRSTSAMDWLRYQLATLSMNRGDALPGRAPIKAHISNASDESSIFNSVPNYALQRQPAAKSVMKALCMYDIQKMDLTDPLPHIHSDFFTMIHRQCQIAYVSHVYRQALLDARKQQPISQSSQSPGSASIVNDRFDDSCDAQELDHALRVMFSTLTSGSAREPMSSGDYSSSFLRAKHVHSMYRALEQNGKKLKRFPEVLFIYLSQQRNTKKGELFDVPLRLEMSNLLESGSLPSSPSEPTKLNTADKSDLVGSAGFVSEDKEKAEGKQVDEDKGAKSRKRLRKKQPRARARRSGANTVDGFAENGDDKAEAVRTDDDDIGCSTTVSRRCLHRNSSVTPNRPPAPLPQSSPEESHDATLNAAASGAPSRLDKWYCLFAVVIREGDSGGVGVGSQTTHTLLLRPEEDGPWFRIAHDRVEMLSPKVDFSEWKCHRDFFCAAAVYVAEDYIDAIANGEVDLEGDMRDLNPELYEKTLSRLGLTEEQIIRRLKTGYECLTSNAQPGVPGFYSPCDGSNGLIKRNGIISAQTNHAKKTSHPISTSSAVTGGSNGASCFSSTCVARGIDINAKPQSRINETLRFEPKTVDRAKVTAKRNEALHLNSSDSSVRSVMMQPPTTAGIPILCSPPRQVSASQSKDCVAVNGTEVSAAMALRSIFRAHLGAVGSAKKHDSQQPDQPILPYSSQVGQSAGQTSPRRSVVALPQYSIRKVRNGTLPAYRAGLLLHHRIYQRRITESIRTPNLLELKRVLSQMVADRLCLCCYDPTAITFMQKQRMKVLGSADFFESHDSGKAVKKEASEAERIGRFRSLSTADLPSINSQQNAAKVKSGTHPAARYDITALEEHTAAYPSYPGVARQEITSTAIPYTDGAEIYNQQDTSLNAPRTEKHDFKRRVRRSKSEDVLTKNFPQRLSESIMAALNASMHKDIFALVDLLYHVHKDVNTYCLLHRSHVKDYFRPSIVSEEALPPTTPSSIQTLSQPEIMTVDSDLEDMDIYIDNWLEKIWLAAAILVHNTRDIINDLEELEGIILLTEPQDENVFVPSEVRAAGHSVYLSNNPPLAPCSLRRHMAELISSANESRAVDPFTSKCRGGPDDWLALLLSDEDELLESPSSVPHGHTCADQRHPPDALALRFPRLAVPDIVCSAVASVVEARSLAEWLFLSNNSFEHPIVDDAGNHLMQKPVHHSASRLQYESPSSIGADAFFLSANLHPASTTGGHPTGLPSPVETTRPKQFYGLHRVGIKDPRISETPAPFPTPLCRKTEPAISPGKRRRSESDRGVPNVPESHQDAEARALLSQLSIPSPVASVKEITRPAEELCKESSMKSLFQYSDSLVLDQDLAHLIDPEDFISLNAANEFHQAYSASFGRTTITHPEFMPYLSPTASVNSDGPSLKSLRALDSVLGSVAFPGGLQQLVNSPRYVRISICCERDLRGLEGFACEQNPPVMRALTARRDMPMAAFYGLIRVFLHQRSTGRNPASPILESVEPLDPPTLTSSGRKTAVGGKKTKGVSEHTTVATALPAEKVVDLSTGRPSRQKLLAPWKATQIDSFMLYALVPDPDLTRKGRQRYTYMQPDDLLDTYCDSRRKLVDPEAPDVIVLLMPCHVEGLLNVTTPQTKKSTGKASTPATKTGTAPAMGNVWLPRPDDVSLPLLIFKWFDHSSLDLICMGAQVCDSRKRLEDYIVDWLLALVRKKHLLPPLDPLVMRDDISNYVVVEECHIRACQNVRRFNAAIKKINKKAGDVIIVQLKKEIASPSSVIEKLGTEVLKKLSQNTFMHATGSLLSDAMAPTTTLAPGVISAVSSAQGEALTSGGTSPECGHVLGKLDAAYAAVFEAAAAAAVTAAGGASSKVEEEAAVKEETKPPKTTQGKKKRRSGVIKTTIPANTKSRIRAQIGEDRRREASLLKEDVEREGSTLHDNENGETIMAPVGVEIPSEASPIEVLDLGAGNDHEPQDLDDDDTKVERLESNLAQATASAQNSVNDSSASQASVKMAVHLTLKIKGTKKSPPEVSSVPPVSKANSTAISTGRSHGIKEQSTSFSSTATPVWPTTINKGQPTESKTDSRPVIAHMATRSEVRHIHMLLEPGQSVKDRLRATNFSTLPDLPVSTNSDSHSGKLPFAAEAVLSTFPDSFAVVMRRSLTFKCPADPNGLDSEGGLENLKVLLHGSVLQFVHDVTAAALEQLEDSSLTERLNLQAPLNYRTAAFRSSSAPKPNLHNLTQSEARVSKVAQSTAYHIDRLFNDYLRDDKQNQQEIVREFRQLLTSLIMDPVTAADYCPAAYENKDFRRKQTNIKGTQEDEEVSEEFADKSAKIDSKSEADDGEDEDFPENEAALFERSLSSRQLALLELFAALFLTSDLIGARKGLHALSLSLLGDSGSSVLSASTGGRKAGQIHKTAQHSWGASDSSATSDLILHHCSALCSLCFLFFVLGSKQVMKLGDSQVGRRYFDLLVKRLSDWLRRLSVVAFIEFDWSNSPAAACRQQLLLRYSYWALVLILKDIVSSRSSVTAAILSREAEAALALASLPFPEERFLFKPPRIKFSTAAAAAASRAKGATVRLAVAPITAPRTTTIRPAASSTGARGVEGKRKASWAAMAQSFATEDAVITVAGSPSHAQQEEGKKLIDGRKKVPRALTSDVEKEDHYYIEDVVEDVVDEDEDEIFGQEAVEESVSEEEVDEYDDEEETPVPSHRVKGRASQILKDRSWGNARSRLTDYQSSGKHSANIISIAAAVAASPGKLLVASVTGERGSSNSRSAVTWSRTVAEKAADAEGVSERALSIYNRCEDRLNEMRFFLDRRTGRPRVSKDKPRVVHESRTWFVTYKPAFWHCSGPSHSVDRPIDLHKLKQGDIDKALKHVQDSELQHSGRMESFHLWLMKQFPNQETIRRWTELECGLCHRIDLETSGAVLIARTRRARDFLWDQFRRRNVHKEYLLLCHGRIKNRFGVVKTRLLTKDYDSRSRIKSHFTQVVEEGGEDSLTEYHLCRVYRRKQWSEIIKSLLEQPPPVGEYVLPSPTDVESDDGIPQNKSTSSNQKDSSVSRIRDNTVERRRSQRSRSESLSTPDHVQTCQVRRKSSYLEQSSNRGRIWVDPALTGELTVNDEFSLCKCRIVTGRTHQIRVHMRHIGHPLVSDTKYLETRKCQEDRQWCPRMFLHAAVLEFADPDAPNAFVEALCPLAHELVQALDTALVCIEDYEPISMEQYGIPPTTTSPLWRPGGSAECVPSANEEKESITK